MESGRLSLLHQNRTYSYTNQNGGRLFKSTPTTISSLNIACIKIDFINTIIMNMEAGRLSLHRRICFNLACIKIEPIHAIIKMEAGLNTDGNF